MHIKPLLLSFLLLVTLSTSAQISDLRYQKVDSLFLHWNMPNHPGGAIAVMQNGKTVFSQAYGLASLEYLVPNSTETIFNTGSVSKQFTAMGIVLLHEQGKLSVDDDIRKHLPELPDFGETITIRHLLHHTSGLRSLHAMLALAGWRGDDSRTNADLDRFMLKQRELNFSPGSEYLYCNTGYMLMVNIIESVTGEAFKEWMKSEIFEPLGMTHTYVEDKYNRVVPNNATSYYQGDEFERAVEYWGYIGSGNMHSTTSDLLKWLRNFYDPQPGWESSFKLLQTVDSLTNGEPNPYAFGIILDEFRGEKRIQHGGAIGGFRAFICTYPEQQLNVVVLTNFSSSSPAQKANSIAEILLKSDHHENTLTQNEKKALKPIRLPVEQLKKFEASYWNDKEAYVRKVYVMNDTLRYFRSENSETALIPIGKNEFRMAGSGAEARVRFETDEKGEKSMLVLNGDESPVRSTSFVPGPLSTAQLASYTGTFYSPELETSYRILLEGEKLKWYHPRHGYFDMEVLKEDVLKGQGTFRIIRFRKNGEGEITGLLVSNGRVINLWFEKQQ